MRLVIGRFSCQGGVNGGGEGVVGWVGGGGEDGLMGAG